ncbi:MAG: lysine--tRNA ligase [Anaerolineae bacterium]
MTDLDHRSQRIAKLEQLREQGIDPYPARVYYTHTAAEALAAFEAREGEEGPHVQVVGRMVSQRIMGRSSFAHLADGSGKIQIYVRQDVVGEESYHLFRRMTDLGDFLEAEGDLFRTRTGEITVRVSSLRLIAKALRPMPEKWHGLRDVETRYRQRYLDLMANENVRQIFLTRSRMVAAIRRFLDDRGFIEVETPILQPIYGGAAARPFVTHHNALDQRLYLRIADELYLKRLIIGGLDRVYEIGHNFRNEGISTKHNPEFTLIEIYQAYADYHDIMDLVEELYSEVAREVLGSDSVTYQGETIDLSPPWRRITMRDAILDATGLDIAELSDYAALWRATQEQELSVGPQPSWGKLVDALFGEHVEPKLVQPTSVLDYPREISPLAKNKPGDPDWVERFEYFIAGMESGNAFSELNDPLEQRSRFAEQGRAIQAGDEEAHPMDEDFLTALEHGMPPTGGLGFGIDRMAMLFTDQTSIREVILFPQLRSID